MATASSPWISGPVICAVCLFRWVAVRPYRKHEQSLECPRCGFCAGGVRAY